MILRLKGGFVGSTHGDLRDPKVRQGSRPHWDCPQGLESHQEPGQSSPATQARGLLSWLLSAHLLASWGGGMGRVHKILTKSATKCNYLSETFFLIKLRLEF